MINSFQKFVVVLFVLQAGVCEARRCNQHSSCQTCEHATGCAWCSEDMNSAVGPTSSCHAVGSLFGCLWFSAKCYTDLPPADGGATDSATTTVTPSPSPIAPLESCTQHYFTSCHHNHPGCMIGDFEMVNFRLDEPALDSDGVAMGKCWDMLWGEFKTYHWLCCIPAAPSPSVDSNELMQLRARDTLPTSGRTRASPISLLAVGLVALGLVAALTRLRRNRQRSNRSGHDQSAHVTFLP